MLPADWEHKGCLLMLTINDLITYVARDYPLKNFEILVVTKNIITENRRTRDNGGPVNDNISSESKYDNVDFMPSLIPSVSTLGLLYSGQFGGGRNGWQEFRDSYELQLSSDEIFQDLVCIVDMIVNDHVPTIILYCDLDAKMGYPTILSEYIQSMFGLASYTIDEFLDPNVDVTNFGNPEEIHTYLDDYMKTLSGTSEADNFYNHLVDSLRGKYKELLEKKSEEDLSRLAADIGVYIRKRDKKDDIIRKIIDAKAKGTVR